MAAGQLHKREKLKDRLAFVATLIITVIMLFPILWMLGISLKTRIDALAMPPRWFFRPTLENYKLVFANSDFLHGFENSLIIAVCSLALVLAAGVPAAYALARFKFTRKKDIAFWILSTRMAPPVSVLIPFYLMFRSVGLTDTKFALVIMHVTINLALVIWVMRSFFQEIPRELEEAALIDGCTPLSAFTRIVLPLSANGIVATAILGFVFSWNELMFALVLAGGGAKTAPAFVCNYISYQEIIWGQLAASGVIVSVPVLIFIGMVQKYLVRGLALGALKQ
ncbi:MAG: carbohydrate ABC transporter permease [Firmicutes bacterium]|nr:carbohydrate ABC transporter permease [Bacillota bacterium]